MRVIIAGSRTFVDYPLLKEKCDNILKDRNEVIIVSGTAKGADKLGEQYATERGYTIEQFPADWDAHGKKAGFLRNQQMAKASDALIAFWDGNSPGTANIIDIANRENLKVRIVKI